MHRSEFEQPPGHGRGEEEALCDFLEQWHLDGAAGSTHDLAFYLARFPDAQPAIAREYLRLTAAPLPDGAGLEPSGAPPAQPRGALRYERLGEIARGGMGRVERVRDERFGRDLAMKSALRSGVNTALRFEKEARLTGQLDHPGIVPVYDFGTGDEEGGAAWFTMRLVAGRDLREIIQLVHSGSPEWSMTAALSVLLRVCETVAYAHSRGIVHRDLKPANVRVGQFGEVYVMDWGLARAEHQPDVNDLRLRVGVDHPVDDRESLLLTMDGDVVGTPCNMSPEQAAGRLEEVGPRSDVYSVGAMLYELLSGQMPYVASGETTSSRVVLARVLEGAPRALEEELAPEAAPELVAVCAKAMNRAPSERYRDMREMAVDVRAHLEGRVVQAYRTGVRAELVKWFGRNRRLAWSIGAGLAVALAATIMFARVQARDRDRLRLQSDSRAPADLVARAQTISTGRPSDAPLLSAWLSEAREVLGHLPSYEREFTRLRARALPWDPKAPRERAAAELRIVWIEGYDRLIAYYEAELRAMRAEARLSEEGLGEAEVTDRLASLKHDRESYAARPIERLTYDFERPGDAERYTMIERLLADVAPMTDRPPDPLRGGVEEEGLVSVLERRLADVSTLEERTLVAGAEAWQRAIASIADVQECPRYAGLVIRPQLGLVPLARNPETGLWEFLHGSSGGDGQRGGGIVLVLIPGARVDLGAQASDPARPGYDPDAQSSESYLGAEGPELLHAILAPFFIGKYEVTQAQWRVITGKRPSGYTALVQPDLVRSEEHPVESVDWNAARAGLEAVGLTLPTEAQWEYAARAGSVSPWWMGGERESTFGAANLADARAVAFRFRQQGDGGAAEPCDDGFALHAPVGSFAPNGFGLYDVCGNVNEWCLDAGFIGYDRADEVLIDTFERRLWGEGLRVRRGGSFEQRATLARSAARQFNGPEYKGRDTGLRAARGLSR